MTKIFFSYGHDNYKKFILKVKDYLTQKGYEVFIDSEKLKAGNEWEHQLEIAIGSRTKFLFFITPHSARRPNGYCLNEISLALHLDKDIIPIMIDFEIPPLSIIRTQYLDLQSLAKKQKIDQNVFKDHMEHLIDVLEGRTQLDFEGEQARLFKELKPIDFKMDIAKHKNLIGREWILKRIDKWISEQPESRVLWITANAGYGKSAISTHLMLKHPDVIGVHFCNYNYPNKKDPINVIKTLAFQIKSQLPEYQQRILYTKIQGKSIYELFEILILNPLYELKLDKTYIFIIDALDEAIDENNQNKLADLIRNEFNKLPKNIKIIITSRPEPILQQQLSNLKPLILEAQNEDNVEDCKAYIIHNLSTIKNAIHLIENEKFIMTLLDKSEAYMLYMKMFFESVIREEIDLAQPEKFPKGLNGIYYDFFMRITESEDEYYEKYAPIFEVMIASKEPLSKQLLADILGRDRIDIKRAINKFKTMVEEKDGLLSFYHKTLEEWLQMDDNVTYEVSVRKGKQKIKSFIEKMDADTYREEYLKFFELNRMLVDYYYEEDKKLNKYFELIGKWENKKKYIDLLLHLCIYFPKYIRSTKCIILLEKSLIILEKLYKIDINRWANDYTINLSFLVESYNGLGKELEANELQEKLVDTFENLYKKNPDKWNSDYAGSLVQLAGSRSGVFEAFPSIDEKRILAAIELQEKAVLLYEKDNGNASVLGKLAYFYKLIGNMPKAIELEEKKIAIFEKLYESNPKKYVNDYTSALKNLAHLIFYSGDISLAIDLINKAIIMLERVSHVNSYSYLRLYKFQKVLYDKKGDITKVRELERLIAKFTNKYE